VENRNAYVVGYHNSGRLLITFMDCSCQYVTNTYYCMSIQVDNSTIDKVQKSKDGEYLPNTVICLAKWK